MPRPLPRRFFAAGFPSQARILLLLGGLVTVSCVTESRLDPRVPERARAASQAQRWPEAQEWWSKVLAHSGGQDEEARFALAEALLEGDRPQAALRVLLDTSPPEAPAIGYWKLVGRAQLGAGRQREAGEAFVKVLAHAPDDRETLVWYGESLLEGERARRGVDLLLRALRLDVGDGPLAERTIQRANELGLWAQSFEASQLRLQAPDAPWHAYLGAAQSADLDPETKGAWLFEAARLNPQSSVAWRHIGDWHLERGETPLAVRAWRKSVEADPMDEPACRKLAEHFIATGDLVTAREWIDHGETLATNPHDREAWARLRAACGE